MALDRDTGRILRGAVRGTGLTLADAYTLIRGGDDALPALLAAAGDLRDRGKGRTVTYSRKVFLPITNLCRDRCSYCTFRKDPDDPGAWTMSRAEIQEAARTPPQKRTPYQEQIAALAEKQVQRAIRDALVKPPADIKKKLDELEAKLAAIPGGPHSLEAVMAVSDVKASART